MIRAWNAGIVTQVTPRHGYLNFVTVLIFLGAWLFSADAGAQALCGSQKDVLAALASRFQEFPTEMGLTNGEGLLELLTSADGATWTLVMVAPDGLTCVIATGKQWKALPPPGAPL